MAYTPSCMHMALLQALSILLLASMSMLMPGSAEEAPSGYRIELIHVDANGGFTREELIRRAVDRTHLRAAMLSATDDTNSPVSSGTHIVEAVTSHYEYLMKLEIGTPAKPFWAVADTGSDLVWTKQMKLCDRNASSTFTNVNCPDSCPDTCSNGMCTFEKRYGSGKKTARGFMGNETLTLSGRTTDKINVSFGCVTDNDDRLLPKSADGIVGLNRGRMSLVKQLNVTKFSYCLSNQLNRSSRLWFGDDADLGLSAGGENISSSLQTTPLVQIPEGHSPVMANKYYVELDAISIGGNNRSLPKDDIKFKSTNDKAVMFIDSGCARTVLERTVFGVLKELLAEELKLKVESFITKSTHKKNTTCFQPPAAGHSKPEMVLYFAGQAKMRLPWANYTDEHKAGSLICLAILEAEKFSILGNFQQQNIHMLYDLTAEKLSFVQDVDCTKL